MKKKQEMYYVFLQYNYKLNERKLINLKISMNKPTSHLAPRYFTHYLELDRLKLSKL